ncbi:universal stress protein [uncultured Ilumatobacter sp.]|uniref:universal stress protein n=1 Tax=uncultured Ilumatobacter sp. TaxID=879968 RepID=UPI00374F12DA
MVWPRTLPRPASRSPAISPLRLLAPRLKELADDSTLFVVGARGRRAVGAMMLGSVSSGLLHHVDVPMVVVPVA